MDEYLSGTYIIPLPYNKDARPMTLPLPFGKSVVLLVDGWENDPIDSNHSLSHELGHVWDFNSGKLSLSLTDLIEEYNKGKSINPNIADYIPAILKMHDGVSDQLNTYIGGTVVKDDGVRFLGPTGNRYIPNAYLWVNGYNNNYGNNSTGDYLAEAWNVVHNNKSAAAPDSIVARWMDNTIVAETDALINNTPVTPVPTLTSVPTPTPIYTSTPTPTITPSATPQPQGVTTPVVTPTTTQSQSTTTVNTSTGNTGNKPR